MPDVLKAFLEWYSNAPDPVQAAYVVVCGGIVTGLLAYLGVCHAANTARAGVENGLRLNREKNHHESELALKTDVYLNACEGLSVVLVKLNELDDMARKESFSTSMEGFLIAVFQLRMIGTIEVVKAVDQLRELILSRFHETVERLAARDLLTKQFGFFVGISG